MNEDINIESFKQKLEEELKTLEEELTSVGRKNPDVKTDWEAKPADLDTDTADDSELADKIEEYEENAAILSGLEEKFNDVKLALQKIEEGRYGLCEVDGKPIEKDRLEANPAARTCKEHMSI